MEPIKYLFIEQHQSILSAYAEVSRLTSSFILAKKSARPTYSYIKYPVNIRWQTDYLVRNSKEYQYTI
jgi:hypothetical protein